MALAILRRQDADDESVHVDIDIGMTNRYYRYQIGDKAIRRFNGLKRLAYPTFTSSLMGPLPPESLGRQPLAIPKAQLDRKRRYIQLFSFRTPQLEGPALSEIVAIPIVDLQPEPESQPERLRDRTPISLSLEDSMQPQTIEQPLVETVAFSYKEAPPVDMAIELGVFSSVIGKLVPLAKKAASAVVTSPQAKTALKQAGSFLKNPQTQQMLMNAGASLLSNPGQPGQAMNTQAMIQLLMNFLNQSAMATTGTPGAGAAPALTAANPMGTLAARQNGQAKAMATAGAFSIQPYSQARTFSAAAAAENVLA